MRIATRVFLCAFFLFEGADVQAQYWTVGPKLGYTLGDNGGFTWGFEASYIPAQHRAESDSSFIMSIWGLTADLTFWKDHTTFHLGVEKNLDIFGLDVGPTLFFHNGSIQGGLSLIPYGGALIYGYYELAWPFFQEPFRTWGGYLKIPLVNFLRNGSWA
jgi:hypothetical protein